MEPFYARKKAGERTSCMGISKQSNNVYHTLEEEGLRRRVNYIDYIISVRQ